MFERLNKRFKKKGYSTGFAWVFGLVSLFGLGLMYIVFSQVFHANLIPIIKDQINSSFLADNIDTETINQANAGIDKYMVYFDTLPFILFFIIIIYMVVAAVRKERESEFQ